MKPVTSVYVCTHGWLKIRLADVKVGGEREIGVEIVRDPMMCEEEEIQLSAADARRLAEALLQHARYADLQNTDTVDEEDLPNVRRLADSEDSS